ncbi:MULTISPECIES: FAD-binding protein [unclassified Dietzia]|uniref:FAD-binding protein n=1 Tax=Dietzia TaxID=37914 RepID=UPI000804FB9E|nr:MULTISPECIES: FAD-binding protein [unclassified Dietzia]OAV78745.1 fumarate reductase [Dietzia sp. 111N12-1]
MTAQDNTFDAEFDVVVVGSGVAALFGAAAAAARGLSTCLIEKTDRFGGTSAYSGGAVWLPGNSVLARDGVEDSVERGRTYFRAVVGDRTAADVQDAFLNTGPQVVEFLQDELGIPTRFQAFPDYFDAPGRQELGRSIYPKPIKGEEVGDRATDIRPPVPADQFGADEDTTKLEGGRAWVARLVLALDAMDTAETRLNTAAEELVRDDDGRVVGVVVNGLSGRQVLGARRGVLVAAGGFERSADLRRRWQDMPTADWSSSHPATGSGDAVRMFEQVGAELDLLDQSWWCPATLFPNGHAAFTLGFRSGIIVDGTGRRFANELLPYDQMGRWMHARMSDGAGDDFWLVFDDAEAGGYPAICIPAPEPDALRGAGLWHTAGSVEELAEATGLDPAALRESVDRFNGFAEQGRDADFARGEDPYGRFFLGASTADQCLRPVGGERFHAVRLVLGDLGTKGGAVIDANGAALDADGRPIPGLYAAGNSSASVSGEAYPGPGVPLGSGMTMAYRAVADMAGQALPIAP